MIALGVAAGIWQDSAAGRVIREGVEPELEEMENEVAGISYGFEFTAHILSNNLLLAAQIVGLGVLFGIFPIFALIINGLVIGYIPFYLSGVSPLEFFSAIIPHGLIELSAFMIAITCGMMLGIAAAKALVQEDRLAPLRAAGRDVRNLLPVVFLLLIVAGFIEGFISPLSGGGIEYVNIILGFALFAAMLYWFIRKPKRVGRLGRA
jgi:stage II sporulation protein M